DVVFHLAGDPVAEGRWTHEKKRRIRDSRVLGTRNLVAGFAALRQRPSVLVSASAVGYYGDRGDETLAESAPAGAGFLPEVCEAWEREALAAEALGVRVVCLRIGIVLARGGGALARMWTPFKLGAGAQLGAGRQWMPWIHADDVVGLMQLASQHAGLQGPMNAVAPAPVTNAEFTAALGYALGRPALLRAPAAALRLAFGEMSEIMLASQRAVPALALRSGYRFQYAELGPALEAIVGAPQPRAA
ncbi:MAG TPA: TIGR01777 family oxidoreductase, partial [Polyangiales bacterium]